MKRFVNKVTVTGADDSIDPYDLIAIAQEYPFVEFGILLSRKMQGERRFPSKEWIEKYSSVSYSFNTAGHLCGSWVKELLMGEMKSDMNNMFYNFPARRWQINTHGIKHKWNVEFLNWAKTDLRIHGEYVIFQNDGEHDDLIKSGLPNAHALFDLSHGAGVLPSEWPKPLPNIYCGYAGGLSPDNVREQLIKLEPIVGNRRIWIDAETQLRSPDDTKFDLDKVRNFLGEASEFII